MYNLAKIAEILKTSCVGDNVVVQGFSTDTRKLNKGDLFIALQGEQFDGHDYLNQAQQAGAVAALVSESVETNLPYIRVDDTLAALAQLATWHRAQYQLPVICLTGSCGKTTTKALLQHMLSLAAPVVASMGNFNNNIGLPLSILQLNADHRFAVFELGANHVGEIAELTKIAQPTVALITCVRPVHIEGFGSIENIAKAKGEIYTGLVSHGLAIINADEPYAAMWQASLDNQPVLTFGLSETADIRANKIKTHANGQVSFDLFLKDQRVPIDLNLVGEHNVTNALAAAAVAFANAVPTAKIQQGLQSFTSVAGRMVIREGLHNSFIIDDHYNSNPAALQAALKVLAVRPGEKILVMGDMLELGEAENEIHAEAADWAKQAGVSHLFAYGDLTKNTVARFGQGATHYTDHIELAQNLQGMLSANTSVLIKGSRGMRLENVVKKIIKE